MEIAGYIASLFIGVSLGLIGGGGSILTVPVLVYLFAISPPIAISYSLFIVGFTSLVGAYNNYRKGLVNFKTVLLFGSASITTVFIARKFIIPLLPNVFFKVSSYDITQALFVMVVFAILMLAAAVSMIRSKKIIAEEKAKSKPLLSVVWSINWIGNRFLRCWWRFFINTCFSHINEAANEGSYRHITINNCPQFYNRFFRRHWSLCD